MIQEETADPRQALEEAVITGQGVKAMELTRKALEAGAEPQDLINDVLIPALRLDYRTFPSNWELIKDRYLSRTHRYRVPDLPSIVFQATLLGNRETHGKALANADIRFRPKVREIGFLDWSAFGRAVEIGYRHAGECLEQAGRAWLEPDPA